MFFANNFCHKGKVTFLECNIWMWMFWYQYWPISREKNFWPNLVESENFGHQECNFPKKLLKIQENVLSKQVLDFV
jgi:hypothetical protein